MINPGMLVLAKAILFLLKLVPQRVEWRQEAGEHADDIRNEFAIRETD